MLELRIYLLEILRFEVDKYIKIVLIEQGSKNV